MPTLSTELRNQLEKAVIAARNLGEKAAKAALEGLAVNRAKPDSHMADDQKRLRNHLRARARQLGDKKHANDEHDIRHLAHECAYEHWHRMLFARFLAANHLLIEPQTGVAVSLDECKELAKEEKTDLWTLAGRYAQKMLPQIFRPDDPLLQVPLAKEHQVALEALVNDLPKQVFTATDSLGWCYQFWQTERKDEVNASGNKIGAGELPAVTQLFTEDYMVDFLLDNTLGAWWAGKFLAAHPKIAEQAKSEDDLRRAVALPGVEWKYLRLIKNDGRWTPAAGTFDGWPKMAKELKCLDPCCGSGHFEVAMFERMVALRMAEEGLSKEEAVVAVLRDNIFGLEIDPRCTQIAAFNLALAGWKLTGYQELPELNIACSGLAPNARKEEWLELAGKSEKLQRGMERLYELFQRAPVLGSLINPRASEGDLLVAAFHELQPLLAKALMQEASGDEVRELAVTARGLAKAAEILASQFSLIATNVPYLGRGKQDDVLKDYCQRHHPDAKADIATCFVERCLAFCATGGSTALVTPQYWLFLAKYLRLREKLLEKVQWDAVAKLGARAFETISGEFVNVSLVGLTHSHPSESHTLAGLDVGNGTTPDEKVKLLRALLPEMVSQGEQLSNPSATIATERQTTRTRLGDYIDSYHGITTTDLPRFARCIWENHSWASKWVYQQGTVDVTIPYSGRECVLLWEDGKGGIKQLRDDGATVVITGLEAWGKWGIVVNRISLAVTVYSGDSFDTAVAVLIPRKREFLLPIWTFCSSAVFKEMIRNFNDSMVVEYVYFPQVPFDLAHWQKEATKTYPHGLPKPHSDDPTQWLFNGYPKDSDKPLHVAVARLLGYRWPRQTGTDFPDCPALKPDGLEKLADTDGIVCIPSVRGEEPAAERLRKMLAAAYGKEWKPELERKLMKDTASDAEDLDEWLRNDFFPQHCDLFHKRPFVWHIWDGRKRDGFHALVNYHKLADGAKGKKVLESLTHSYLNDWIGRQRDGIKRGEDGAEERLAAAQELKQRLEAIIEGEPPFDIFVRWKPLAKQAIGWEPDINDGVRMNIRPFLASDLPGGRTGAGILRSKPNVKWDKDRGKEPHRPKNEFPWFWSGNTFTGDRLNAVHLTNEQKAKAKKEVSS